MKLKNLIIIAELRKFYLKSKFSEFVSFVKRLGGAQDPMDSDTYGQNHLDR